MLKRWRACACACLCLCDDLGTYSKTNKRTPFLNNLAPLCSDGTSPVGSSVAFSIIGRGGGQFQPFFPHVCAVLTTNLQPEKGWPAAGCVWLEVKLTAASWVTPSICNSPASAGWSWRSPITTGPVQVPLGTLHLPPEGLDDLLSSAVVSQLIMLIIVVA